MPHRLGYYWIFTGDNSNGKTWEIAYFDGERWWVFGKEYSYSAEELKITNWEGPLVYGGG